MATFGGLTPDVIDGLKLSDFLLLVNWAEDEKKRREQSR